jgi:hypothetical protein
MAFRPTISTLLKTAPLAVLAIPLVHHYAMSTSSSSRAGESSRWPTRAYTPRHASWPYTERDFERYDPDPDPRFYHMPRLVNHIDDHAIETLRRYYGEVLPTRGRILDFCSSWVSHFPEELHEKASKTAKSTSTDSPGTTKDPLSTSAAIGESGDRLEVIGMGMNRRELDNNPVLSQRIIQDLNQDPSIPLLGPLSAATCVVSIDYLVHPVKVLKSLKESLVDGAKVHLIISNRCFPTKAIKRWLNLSESERLDLVGDYLHFAGYEGLEIIELNGKKSRYDPLWVVTGRKGSGPLVPSDQ